MACCRLFSCCTTSISKYIDAIKYKNSGKISITTISEIKKTICPLSSVLLTIGGGGGI